MVLSTVSTRAALHMLVFEPGYMRRYLDAQYTYTQKTSAVLTQLKDRGQLERELAEAIKHAEGEGQIAREAAAEQREARAELGPLHAEEHRPARRVIRD